MGIQGLLPFLKNAMRPGHIKDFRGCTVAIDAYCWLHKGAFACAEKLAAGQETDMYVYYCLKYVNMLLSHGIKPIMVFDGCHLPSKREVEKKRREKRALNRKKAAQLLREGKRKEARDAIVQCIDITPQMALELMNACRNKGVDCITAPYEADAQLAYLNKIGVAQIIITEDSDLILFGCEKVMFKMDTAGAGMLVDNRDLNQAMGLQASNYTFDKFRHMCIMSGCDYLPSLPGVGLFKACKALKLTRQTDMRVVLKKLPKLLNSSSLPDPDDSYIEGFVRADNTFLYQLVFDPLRRKILPLNPYPPGVDASQMDYAGPPIPQAKALQIALGNIDIYTGEVMAHFDPATHKPKSSSWCQKNPGEKDMLHMLSMWDPNYRPRSKFDPEKIPKDTQRPTTVGKEISVKATGLPTKPRPLKRPLEEGNQKDPLPEESPEDIASQYSMKPHSQPTNSETPVSKKQKLSCDSKVFCLEDSKPSVQKLIIPDRNEMNPVSCDGEKKKLKERHMSKNMFAAGGREIKRERFSLDAEKKEVGCTEVKSRFFASSKPLEKTSFYSALAQNHQEEEPVGTTPQPHSTRDQEVRSVPQSGNDDASCDEAEEEHLVPQIDSREEPTMGSCQNTESVGTPRCASPYPSCGLFSKLDQFKSKFDLKSSKSVNKPFKPVTVKSQNKDNNSMKSLKQCSNSQEGVETQDLSDAHSIDFNNSQQSNTSVDCSSQRSSLYSIDADCWKSTQNSQDISLTESNLFSTSNCTDLPLLPRSPSPSSRSSMASRSRPNSPPRSVSGEIKGSLHVTTQTSSFIECTEIPGSRTMSIKSETEDLTKDSQMSTTELSSPPAAVKKASPKGTRGCRGVGLSKSGSSSSNLRSKTGVKTPGKVKGSQENQPTLHNFFTKNFAFEKKSVKKLSPSEKPPTLSPRKANIMVPDT